MRLETQQAGRVGKHRLRVRLSEPPAQHLDQQRVMLDERSLTNLRSGPRDILTCSQSGARRRWRASDQCERVMAKSPAIVA